MQHKSEKANMKPYYKRRTSKLLSATAAALLISSAGTFPASSDDCSDEIANVEAALSTANITAEDMVKVEVGHATAVSKQVAGDSAGCVEDLQEAKSILNLE